MSHIRWKLSGGILLLSMGGLVALADVPKEVPAEPPPLQIDISSSSEPLTVPSLELESAPAEPSLPPLKFDLPPVIAIPVEEPVVEVLPMPRKVIRVESTELEMEIPPVPSNEGLNLAAPIEFPSPNEVPSLPSLPVNAEPPVEQQPIKIDPLPIDPIVPEPKAKPTPKPFELPSLPEMKPTITVKPQPIPEPEPRIDSEPTPIPEPAVEPKPTAKRIFSNIETSKAPDFERNAPRTLKVLVHMGGERPWFELRDRDEMYLKVICDNIDVHTPKDESSPVSTIRASGNIRYITPGGQGSCNDLTVSPKDGEVEVTGNVNFRYSWGQVQTTLTAETMTFRLDPIHTSDEPATMPASYVKPY